MRTLADAGSRPASWIPAAVGAWIASSPATASANDGLGALAELAAALFGAGLFGAVPAIFLLVSFFRFRAVRRGPADKRKTWPLRVGAVALAGHLAIAGGAWAFTDDSSRAREAAVIAAVLCGLPFFLLAAAAVVTAFVAGRKGSGVPD